MPAMMRKGPLEDVLLERKAQDDKWGEQNHRPPIWILILLEEIGEASKAILEEAATAYRKELVQCCAVALAALESFDRAAGVGRDERCRTEEREMMEAKERTRDAEHWVSDAVENLSLKGGSVNDPDLKDGACG